ncbi:hypothetical protein GCM10011504_57250 [Siccirubricoccus deserti]|nr:hypothetical protein GCM10011504_57250 [Siccirubricoccus deserti]
MLRDIAVDEAALLLELSALQSESGAIDAEWRFQRRPEGEFCLVKWGEAEILIPLLGREAVSRGMRAIAVLLQSPRVPVANLLLAELERRHVNTRPEKGKSTELAAAISLRASLRPLCQSLFAGAKTVEKAHVELVGLLRQSRGLDKSFTDDLPRSLLLTDASGTKRQKLMPVYGKVGQTVRDSLKVVWKVLAQQEGGAAVADFLKQHIHCDAHTGVYDPRKVPVRWRAGGDPAGGGRG